MLSPTTDRSTARWALLLLCLLTLGLIPAGCGAEEKADEVTETAKEQAETVEEEVEEAVEGEVITIDVKPGTLTFEKDELIVPAGKVTLKSKNPDAVEHNIAVEGDGVDEEGELVSNGGVSEVTVELKAGKTYEFYCTPHRSAGMKGTITVT